MRIVYTFEEGDYVIESPKRSKVNNTRFLYQLYSSYEDNEDISIIDEKSGEYIKKKLQDIKSISIIFDN